MAKYNFEQIQQWAERYKKLKSFTLVAKEFGVNVKTVNKQLKLHKNKLELVFEFEVYHKNKLNGLKTCCDCKTTKSINEFSTIYNGRRIRSYCNICKEKRNKQYVDSHKTQIREVAKKRRQVNANKISEYRKQKYNQNKDFYCERQRELYKQNHEQVRLTKNRYHKNRMARDPVYAITRTIRARLSVALKNINGVKDSSTLEMIGCSIEQLRLHLESKFYPNPETGEMMTWKNKGLFGWHIDHIRPLSSFNLEDTKQLKQACHYTNLQPLWAKDNLQKGAKIINTETT